MAQAQDHNIVDQALVQLDIQHPVGAHQIVCRSQRLPPGIFQCSTGILDTVDQIHIVPPGPLVTGHTARLIQQVEHPPDAAADIAHTLALAVLIGGKRGVERAVDVAHRLGNLGVVLGVQVHLNDCLLLLLFKQPFQRGVLLHGLFVGAAEQDAVDGALHPLLEGQLVTAAVLQLMPAQQHLHLRSQPDALGLAHHRPPAERPGQAHLFAGCLPPGQAV